MVQGEAILVIDLGNSSTKVTVMFGKDAQTGKYRERTLDLSNVFAPIEENYSVSSDYNSDTSTILSVNTELNGVKIVGNCCNGELQAKEYPLATIKPSAFKRKWDLDASVLSLRLAFLNAYKAIMNMQRVSDYTQIDVKWKVVTLLPPGDIDAGKTEMEKLIRDVKTVDSVFPEMHFDINITKVAVLPEGYCAYAAIVYDKGRIYREGYSYLCNEVVMIFDVGAGTTDCMVIKGNTLVQSSKHTVNQGGINVFNLVRQSLRLEGIDIDTDELQTGIIKGVIKDGAKDVNIVPYVNKAKNEVATKIVSDFQDYLSTTDIKMRSVGFVITSGGGSMMDSECPEIAPLSSKIIEIVKQLTPNAEIVKLPKVAKKITDEETGESKVIEEVMSPRFLNLIGASILAEVI